MTEPGKPVPPAEPPGGRDAVDASGAPRDFTVSGFGEDERRPLLEWPDAPALFAHLRSLAGPLRVPDLAAHTCALGFSAFPVAAGAFQATPMRRGEDYVAGFFLGGREGAFTDADAGALRATGGGGRGPTSDVPRPAPPTGPHRHSRVRMTQLNSLEGSEG